MLQVKDKKMEFLRIRIIAAVFFMAAVFSSYADGVGKSDRPKYWPLVINDYLFDKIELALTMDEQIMGLMNRDTLVLRFNDGQRHYYPKVGE